MHICDCTQLHNMQHKHAHVRVLLNQQICCTQSQEALLIVYCDQWWVCWVIRTISSVLNTLVYLILEKKPLLSLLFIKSWSRSKKGRCDQQLLPELVNKAFSVLSTQYCTYMLYVETAHWESLMAPDFQRVFFIRSTVIRNLVLTIDHPHPLQQFEEQLTISKSAPISFMITWPSPNFCLNSLSLQWSKSWVAILSHMQYAPLNQAIASLSHHTLEVR